jgi:adenylylsulfate kinase
VNENGLKQSHYWTFKKSIIFGFCIMGAVALGFYSTTTSLGCMIFMKMGAISNTTTLKQYKPGGRDAQIIEQTIDSHSLTKRLRADPRFNESRPHLKLPIGFRQHNLTAGTLLGPGRIVVPPITWVEDGKTLVAIYFLGSDLCGHPGIVHGGVLATILDEGMARCCWDALPRKIAVTGQLDISYRKPVKASQFVVLRAETVRIEGRKAWVKGTITTLTDPAQEPMILTEASGLFISPKQATVGLSFMEHNLSPHD